MKEINQVAIYKPVGLKVKIKNENTWLTQSQISFLFQVDRSVVTKHLKNIFETGELREKSNVQKMHIANSDKPVKAYNLDVIISVGYRVNSIRATQFRIWATKTLKQYLVKGYVLNQKRLKEQQKSLKTLSDSVALIKSKIYSPQLTGQESELLEIVKTYIDSLRLLKLYDDQQLKTTGLKTPVKFILDYEISTTNINKLKQNLIKQNLASDNFGLENGEALKRIDWSNFSDL
jgi:hypothetical protein